MGGRTRGVLATVVVSLALLLAGSLSGCGRPSAEASPSPSKSLGVSASTAPVEHEVVAFQLVGAVPKYATVLDDRSDVLGYSSRLAAAASDDALEEKLTGYDLSGKALLAFHSTIGCDTAGGVELRRAGDDFSIHYLDVTKREECVAPKSTIAIFAVSRSILPSAPTLQGSPPSPAAAGELVGFQQFDPNELPLPEVTATEISQPDQAERFFVQFPDSFPKLAAEVAGAQRKPGSRMFAFPVSGCRNDGAVLVVEPTQLSAVPTGGENVRCVTAEHYIAVFTVDADDVPLEARLAAG